MRSETEAPARWGELNAPAHWRAIDFISDLHLQAGEPATAQAFRRYLQDCQADALLILGDLFEVWIGDDLLDAAPAERATEPEYDFLAGICADLRAFSARRALYVMHGNRDFLLGSRFAATSGATLLDDPTLLRWGEQRVLLSHGDAWCLDDRDYLEFRAQVRSPGWQTAFLQRPLAERAALAREAGAAAETTAAAAPPDDGAPGQVLTTDGSGNETWTTISSSRKSARRTARATASGTPSRPSRATSSRGLNGLGR